MNKLLTSFLLISILSFGQSISKKDTKDKIQNKDISWKTFNQLNYTIQYPSTWVLDESGEMGTNFILFSPLESGNDKFKENVNLLIQDLTGKNIDIDKYTEISESQIKTMVKNANLIESKRIENTKNEYHKIIYSVMHDQLNLQFEQYYWVFKNKAYVLTFTCEKDKFSIFSETGEKILKSFQFIK